MQYGPYDLPIKKPAKIPVSKTLTSKAPTTSSRYALRKDSDPVGQMIVNPTAPKAADAQVSSPRDVIFADPTIETTHPTPTISKVEPGLASKLASSEEV